MRLFFKVDMGTAQDSDRGHAHFLKLTCDIGDPPSRAPMLPNFAESAIRLLGVQLQRVEL